MLKDTCGQCLCLPRGRYLSMVADCSWRNSELLNAALYPADVRCSCRSSLQTHNLLWRLNTVCNHPRELSHWCSSESSDLDLIERSLANRRWTGWLVAECLAADWCAQVAARTQNPASGPETVHLRRAHHQMICRHGNCQGQPAKIFNPS